MKFFNKYFFSVLQYHYADFKGRATRKQYWFYISCGIAVQFFIGFVVIFAGIIDGVDTANKVNIVGKLFALVTFIPGLAIATRRFHDTGRSGWWLLISTIIPIIGWIWSLFVVCEASQKGQNEYGDELSIDQIEVKT